MAANQRHHLPLASGKYLYIEKNVAKPKKEQNTGGDSRSTQTWKMEKASGPVRSEASSGARAVAHLGMTACLES